MKDGVIYVLMVTTQKMILPTLAPATLQAAIDSMCSIEVFPVAASDDVEGLRDLARNMCKRFRSIESWNVLEVPVIGSVGDGDE